MTNSAQHARERLTGALALDRALAAAMPKAQTEFHDVPSSDAVKMGQIFGGVVSDSGAVVNEKTARAFAMRCRCR